MSCDEKFMNELEAAQWSKAHMPKPTQPSKAKPIEPQPAPVKPAAPQVVKATCHLCKQVVEIGQGALASRPAPDCLPGVTDYGVECPACHGWNHKAFIDAKLLRLRGNIRTYTRPVEFAHAVRYYERKFEAFQHDCLATLIKHLPAPQAPTPEQEKIFQAGIEHLEREI